MRLPAQPVSSDSPPKTAAAVAKPDGGMAPLLALLKVEAAARDAQSERELLLLMANETRKLTRARQIFVFRPGFRGQMEVKAVSSVPLVEKNAPVVVFAEAAIRDEFSKSTALEEPRSIPFPAGHAGSPAETYPFRHLHWVPLRHGIGPFEGGLLLAREDPWSDQDLVIASRLTTAYAHALRALSGGRKTRLWTPSKLQTLIAAAAILAVMLLVRVPLKALAPVEIIAKDPFIVAAPIDGVIEAIPVDANQPVKAGDVVVRLAGTTLKNRLEVAERDVQVAEARLKQANQIAFSEARGMHELGIARAELSLKLAERDFARDLLSKTELRAARDGLAIYSDKRELLGKPVAVGERILEIAEADNVEAKIELPVADAIALSPGARVKLFLDSDPLKPWQAEVKHADYKAKIGENDVVSFRVVAGLTPSDGRQFPRLGVRGTAQVTGEDVPLGLYLFRRPITAFRQWMGL